LRHRRREIDYPAHFAALKRDGYTGYISLETHIVPKTGSGAEGKGTAEARLPDSALRALRNCSLRKQTKNTLMLLPIHIRTSDFNGSAIYLWWRNFYTRVGRQLSWDAF